MNQLKKDWSISAVQDEGSRLLYTFSSELFPGIMWMTISVSKTFRDPSEMAWKMLSETVK